MITDQSVDDHEDMRKVTNNGLRDSGMADERSGEKVTLSGREPVCKTAIQAEATTSCIQAPNAVANGAIWKESICFEERHLCCVAERSRLLPAKRSMLDN